MTDPALVVLHVGSGLEVTLLEYLYRVLLHLLAFGGVALLVLRLPGASRAVRSALLTRPGREEGDPGDR